MSQACFYTSCLNRKNSSSKVLFSIEKGISPVKEKKLFTDNNYICTIFPLH